MNLKIKYDHNQLIIEKHNLPQHQKDYLQQYLDQVNRYRPIGFYDKSPVFSLYQPPLASKCGMRSLKHRLSRRFDHGRFPATATISVTSNCQCDCEHCSAVYYNKSKKKILSDSDLYDALMQTVDLGVTTLILLGGEPLLRKNLCQIIAKIPKDKTSIILFTNGELLTDQQCLDLKEAGVMGAFVSIDSVVAQEHDNLRKRKGLFSKALTGIENMRKAGLIAGISSYLTAQRLKDNIFEKMMELAKISGANEVTFFDAIPSGKWLQDSSACLQTNDRQLIAKLTKEYRSKDGYPGLSVQSTMTSECGSTYCFAANTQFYLTAFGEMCPCDFTPLTIGRFPDESIGELWVKMIATSPYNTRAKSCRMQDPTFRANYISKIPAHGPYPYPLQTLSS